MEKKLACHRHFWFVPPLVVRKLNLDPSLFRGCVQSGHQEHRNKDANAGMLVENARFQRNTRGVFELRHFPGCNDLIA